MQHLAFFGLRESPFGITPDTSFFYACESTRAGLNTLLVAIANGEGFVKVTGEVGTGKTLLCRMLLTALEDRQWATAYIHNPDLEPRTLMLAIADELEIAVERDADEHRLLRAINLALLGFARAGKRVVLCLDEAQAMPTATLESLRLLTNLETEKRKLLQVVLFGQPELDAKLDEPRIRQLKQRITFQHRLAGLTAAETAMYLEHRMRVAGYAGRTVFSAQAAGAIHRASRGTPRLVNILAHKALLLAYGRGTHQVGWRDAREAVADTPASLGLASSWSWWTPFRTRTS
jgi:MSHA biogenesis protein MshM